MYLHSPLMNLILGSDESSHYLRLWAIYLPYTYCLDCTSLDEWASLSPLKPTTSAAVAPRSALTHLATINMPRTWEMEKRVRDAVWTSTIWWYGKHLRGLDVEIKEVEEGSHTSFHIPPSLCSVILPCSIVALLIASRFSKGRSISSGSVPRLCLILFCTFVGARKLIKEHLITIACCQWMILNGVTVL